MDGDLYHVAALLGRELGPLRRAVSRTVRSSEGLPNLPDNQIEVLRAVAAQPGINTGSVAARLQLARPTVSNLLSAMRRAGLVDLRRREDDARAVEVHATPAALSLLARFDEVSAVVIAKALVEIDSGDRDALAAALPALASLNDLLAQGCLEPATPRTSSPFWATGGSP